VKRQRTVTFNVAEPIRRSSSISENGRPVLETELDVITDLGDNVYYEFSKLEQSWTDSSRPISYDGSDGPLPGRLYSAIEDTCHAVNDSTKTGFVPKEQLVRIMSEESIVNELEKIERSFRKRIQFWKSTRSRRTIEEEAEIICNGFFVNSSSSGTRSQDGQTSKCFRKILAILLLIERPGTIRKFIEEGLCDANLPLIKVPDAKKIKAFSLCRKSGATHCSLKCLRGWKRQTLVQFEQWQWTMLAPFLYRGEKDKVMHYTLPGEVILPFTYREHICSGAHGDIFKVKIHPEHHNFNNDQVSPFATYLPRSWW
jgi:hypothetical protein